MAALVALVNPGAALGVLAAIAAYCGRPALAEWRARRRAAGAAPYTDIADVPQGAGTWMPPNASTLDRELARAAFEAALDRDFLVIARARPVASSSPDR